MEEAFPQCSWIWFCSLNQSRPWASWFTSFDPSTAKKNEVIMACVHDLLCIAQNPRFVGFEPSNHGSISLASLSLYICKKIFSFEEEAKAGTDWSFHQVLLFNKCWQTEPNTPARQPHRHPTNVRFQQVLGVFLGFSFEFHDLNHSTTSSHVPDVSRLCDKVDKCMLDWLECELARKDVRLLLYCW